MENKEFVNKLVEQINEVQRSYNPTNPPFWIFEEVKELDLKVILTLKHDHETITRSEFTFNNYIDIERVYEEFKQKIMRIILVTPYTFNIIKTIQKLEYGK